jgi:hypothetical protein
MNNPNINKGQAELKKDVPSEREVPTSVSELSRYIDDLELSVGSLAERLSSVLSYRAQEPEKLSPASACPEPCELSRIIDEKASRVYSIRMTIINLIQRLEV